MKLLGIIITKAPGLELLLVYDSEEQIDSRRNDHWVPVGPAG